MHQLLTSCGRVLPMGAHSFGSVHIFILFEKGTGGHFISFFYQLEEWNLLLLI